MFESYTWEEWLTYRQKIGDVSWVKLINRHISWTPEYVLRYDMVFKLDKQKMKQMRHKYHFNGLTVLVFEKKEDAMLYRLKHNG
jgi:hypothetical protein